MSELLPCPGCGANGKKITAYNSNPDLDDMPWTQVICLACGFQAPSIVVWNNRAGTDQSDAREILALAKSEADKAAKLNEEFRRLNVCQVKLLAIIARATSRDLNDQRNINEFEACI